MQKTAVFGYTTGNIGDDMQSFAAAVHLPRVDRIVDRDQLYYEELDQSHSIIFNSWFMKSRVLDTPPPTIDPVMHGFCVGRKVFLTEEWISYLRERQPIGCRDTFSVRHLKKLGLDAYWSGCLTLFLGQQFAPVPREKRSGVLIIDVSEETEQRVVPQHLRERAVRMSNFVPARHTRDRLLRFAYLARLCDQLRHAELVISRRLHVVLPCVGFGTPVVTLPDEGISQARRRFSGYETFLPLAYQGNTEEEQKLDWNNLQVPQIPSEIHEAYGKLRETLGIRLGSVPHDQHERAYLGDKLVLRNPGLGFEGGSVQVKLGPDVTDCDITRWTDKEIEIRLPMFATMRRWSLRVDLHPREGESLLNADLWELAQS